MDQNQSGSNPATARPTPENYKFSPEEMKVLQECNTESFFQRSLPIGSLLGLSTFYGVKAGMLKPHIKWGATPKVMLAVTVGYFIGKFSYQKACAEKFMKLPGSKLGELLRAKRKGGNLQENIESGGIGSMSLAPFAGILPSQTYSDEMPRNYDLDSYRSDSSDSSAYRPESSDSAGIPQDNIMDTSRPGFQQYTDRSSNRNLQSYEDLRKQNRAEYQKTRGVNYRPVVDTPGTTSQTATSFDDPIQVSSDTRSGFDTSSKSVPSFSGGRKNQYGDPVD